MSEDRVEHQEKRNAKLRAQAKADERTRKTVITTLMAARDGRRFVYLELAAYGVFELSYQPGLTFDAVAFREGMRSYGNRLLADVVRYCPKQYIALLQENSSGELEETDDE